MKDGGKGVNKDKGAHQHKDGLGSSGLRGGLGGNTGPANMLDPLLVSVQDEDHGAAGPEHEQETYNIRGC